MWSNLSFFSPVSQTQPLTFFEKHSFELQQQQAKQKKKVQKYQSQKQQFKAETNLFHLQIQKSDLL
jgi:hypothetical protein